MDRVVLEHLDGPLEMPELERSVLSSRTRRLSVRIRRKPKPTRRT